ncbi:MAG: NAD-dependent epimerase/dehydratase family protein [Deltaproteobacteria bacterium]|nr:NAD-dependent epimerase/dehydratase family protein [Deltaproteobacteria bacterium]
MSGTGKTLVTGGTGFVGRAVVMELLAGGREVRVLVRDPEHPALQGLQVETVRGDLRDAASLQTAVKGCSHLFHVAADYRLWVPDPQEMYAVNVQGTKNLLTAAADAGVSRVVYTSTVGALGNPGNGVPGTETTPVCLADMVGPYKRSKFQAEQAVLEFARQGLPVVLVHPSAPVGPWDSRPTPTGKIIVDFLKGRMPAYLETGLNLVHVRDVARGHILAEERGRVGEKYILGHQNMSLSEILQMLAEVSGRPAPKLRLPYFPILCLAYVNEFWATCISRQPPRMPLAAVKMAKKFMYFDSSKAVRELGLPQTPVRQALAEAVSWFKERGYA